MDKDELRAWLRLSMTEGIGNDAARRLLSCFGSPQAVFEQTQAALGQIVTPQQAQALLSVPNELAVQCVRTHQWLMHQPDTHSHALWTLGDARYPSELLQLADPPLMIYVAGQTARALGNAIAIVGSRNPTPQGAQTAAQFGEALSAAGLCVVSGLALGVDGAAHQGALRGGRARDGIYMHTALAHRGRGRHGLGPRVPTSAPNTGGADGVARVADQRIPLRHCAAGTPLSQAQPNHCGVGFGHLGGGGCAEIGFAHYGQDGAGLEP